MQLSPSEELGDLFKGAGDNATALACYQSTGSTTKVVEGEDPTPPLQQPYLMELIVTNQFTCQTDHHNTSNLTSDPLQSEEERSFFTTFLDRKSVV